MRSFLLIAVLLSAPATVVAQCSVTFTPYGAGCQTVVAQVPTLSGSFEGQTCTVSLTLDAFSGCCNTFLTDRLFVLGLQANVALPPWPGCSLLVAPVAVAILPVSGGDTLSFQLPSGLPSFSIYSQGIAIYASTIGGSVPRGVTRAPQFSQGLEIGVAPQNTTQTD